MSGLIRDPSVFASFPSDHSASTTSEPAGGFKVFGAGFAGAFFGAGFAGAFFGAGFAGAFFGAGFSAGFFRFEPVALAAVASSRSFNAAIHLMPSHLIMPVSRDPAREASNTRGASSTV